MMIGNGGKGWTLLLLSEVFVWRVTGVMMTEKYQIFI